MMYSSAKSMMRTQELPKLDATNGKAIRKTASAPYARRFCGDKSLNECAIMAAPSCPVRDAFTHDAGWPQSQDDDQHHEGENILVMATQESAGPVADIPGAQTLDHAEKNSAEHRTINIADAAQHRG